MKNADAITTNEATAIAEQGLHGAPEKATSKKGATAKRNAPKGKKTAKPAAPKKEGKPKKKAAQPEPKASAPRAESKGAKILEMIGHTKGATLAEIMEATDWQAHSVRGFISTAGKKHNIKIESSKNEAGDRLYRIAQ